MSDEKVKIEVKELDEIRIIVFFENNNTFVIAKKQTEDDLKIMDLEKKYDVDGIRFGAIQKTKTSAKKIWSNFISDGFVRLTQLEDIFNNKIDIKKYTDDALYCFKLRDKTTKKYSIGGGTGRLNKQGKTWNQINHVLMHMRNLNGLAYEEVEKNFELVIMKEVDSVNINDVDKVKDEIKKRKRNSRLR